ncbi:hypothetical protein C8R45DRAFT_829279 [Mycena sanguinolenta]|nr:hypothetical protein C8R45DRAFT_829279 [Mycena sanguinolenta]
MRCCYNQYLSSTGQVWRSCFNMPHPVGAFILPPRALKLKHFEMNGQTFSCFKARQNSSGIQFKEPSNSSVCLTGFIDQIWQIPLDGHLQTFFLVQKHKNLSLADLHKTPFPSFPLFQTTAVDAEKSNQFCIIEPRHILTHLTFYHRKKGTYDIQKRILIICWALNRGRRF